MLLLLVLLTLLCLLSVRAFLVTSHRRFVKQSGGIPELSGYLPIIGHGLKFVKTDRRYLWQVITEVSREVLSRGNILTLWFGPAPFCVISNPEYANYLLNACLDKPYFYGFAERWLGDGLVTTLNVSTWKRHRKILKPAFCQQAMDAFLVVFNAQSTLLVEDLASKVGADEFDFTHMTTSQTLKAVSHCTLGPPSEESYKIGDEYEFASDEVYKALAHRTCTIWNHPTFLYKLSKGYKDEVKSLKLIHKVSEKVLQKAKAESYNGTLNAEKIEGKEQFKAFINLVLDNNDGSLSDIEIRNEIDTLITAGYDTTSKTMTAALILIGSFKNVQNKIYEELKEVFGDSKRDVSKEDLQKLVYLDAVMKEVLRLYPSVPLVGRQTICDTRIGNYTIPSGTGIIFTLWAMNRGPWWGPDAEEFRPERWLKAGKLPDSAHGLATFSFGKRNCIGKYFAQQLMKTTLIHVLRAYRVSGDHTRIKIQAEHVVKIVEGNSITIERR